MATSNGVACERLPSRRAYLSARVMPFRVAVVYIRLGGINPSISVTACLRRRCRCYLLSELCRTYVEPLSC